MLESLLIKLQVFRTENLLRDSNTVAFLWIIRNLSEHLFWWTTVNSGLWKEAKILERLNQPNLVNFKNVCYQPLAIMFENISFKFSPFAIIRKICGLDGFLDGFWVIFWLKRWSYSFHDGLQFLPNNGIAHRDLKTANTLVGYNHYANITDAAELNIAVIKTTQYNLNYGDSDFGESRSLIHQTRTV